MLVSRPGVVDGHILLPRQRQAVGGYDVEADGELAVNKRAHSTYATIREVQKTPRQTSSTRQQRFGGIDIHNFTGPIAGGDAEQLRTVAGEDCPLGKNHLMLISRQIGHSCSRNESAVESEGPDLLTVMVDIDRVPIRGDAE